MSEHLPSGIPEMPSASNADYHAKLMAHMTYHRNRSASTEGCEFCREDDKHLPIPVEKGRSLPSGVSSVSPETSALCFHCKHRESDHDANGCLMSACGCVEFDASARVSDGALPSPEPSPAPEPPNDAIRELIRAAMLYQATGDDADNVKLDAAESALRAELSTSREALAAANSLLDKEIPLKHANISEPLTFTVRYLAACSFEIGASPEVEQLRTDLAEALSRIALLRNDLPVQHDG